MGNSGIFNFRNINFYSIVMDVLRGIWIAVVIGCIGVMVTYTYTKDTFESEYTSSAIYVVTPRQSTGYSITNKKYAENVVTVFKNLLQTDIMVSRVKEEMHLNELPAAINIELITETNLMKITVTSDDPVKSFKVINSIMNNYEELSDYLTTDAVFDTLREPVVATTSNNILAPKRKSMQMGTISALITVAILIILSIIRNTIKTENAIEEKLGATLLGTVFHEKKNHTLKAKLNKTVKSLLVTSPIASKRFIEAFNNIRIRLEYEHERHPEKNVYLVSSVCENEGKSTISLNIALSLAQEGKKVMVIDADMRKPAIYKMLSIPQNEVVDLIKVFKSECGMDEVLYHEKDYGMDLIMCTKGHSGTYEYAKSGAMDDLIWKCSKLADYVIIDTPPMALVSDTEVLIDKVDFTMLVVRQDFSYDKDVLNSINIMNDGKSKFLGCVLNNYYEFGANSRRHMNAFEQETGRTVEIYEQ